MCSNRTGSKCLTHILSVSTRRNYCFQRPCFFASALIYWARFFVLNSKLLSRFFYFQNLLFFLRSILPGSFFLPFFLPFFFFPLYYQLETFSFDSCFFPCLLITNCTPCPPSLHSDCHCQSTSLRLQVRPLFLTLTFGGFYYYTC